MKKWIPHSSSEESASNTIAKEPALSVGVREAVSTTTTDPFDNYLDRFCEGLGHLATRFYGFFRSQPETEEEREARLLKQYQYYAERQDRGVIDSRYNPERSMYFIGPSLDEMAAAGRMKKRLADEERERSIIIENAGTSTQISRA